MKIGTGPTQHSQTYLLTVSRRGLTDTPKKRRQTTGAKEATAAKRGGERGYTVPAY